MIDSGGFRPQAFASATVAEDFKTEVADRAGLWGYCRQVCSVLFGRVERPLQIPLLVLAKNPYRGQGVLSRRGVIPKSAPLRGSTCPGFGRMTRNHPG